MSRGGGVSLVELRVADLAVVQEARLEPGRGLTVITGETGAGKSVCIGALRLALGGRADPEQVRPGAAAARVAAVFEGTPERLGERLAELGIPGDELLTLSRELPRAGRSVARVNGALVSQATLAEVGEALAEVTRQGASQRLLLRSVQRQLLDDLGGSAVLEARARMAEAMVAWTAARLRLEEALQAAAATEEAGARASELVAELGPLRLLPGEEADLQREATRLRSAAAIAAAAAALRDAAAGGDDSAGAADLLALAAEPARSLAGIDGGLAALLDEATALGQGLRELAAAARRHAESVALDEARLTAVEERLDSLSRVRHRHGSIEAALAELARAETTVSAAAAGAGLARLEEELEAARSSAVAAATTLHRARQALAPKLERAVTERLRLLELPHARFEVLLQACPDPTGLDLGDGPLRCGAHGVDEVELRLAANRGAEPRPLDSGPSGGELSRLALALGAAVGEAIGPVLVLDEVDSGISGETAARVGDLLAAIGEKRQVIAVTHRSEIAARAETHLLAVKDQTQAGATTRIEVLAGTRRAAEIARLMSGRATPAALARAGELLVEGSSGPSPVPVG